MPLLRSTQKVHGCNLKTMELLDCALIGVYAVIRSNTVCSKEEKSKSGTVCILGLVKHFVFWS